MNQITSYYLEKENNKDCILFYKNGFMYKTYEEDAILISYLLNTKLKHKNNSFYETTIQEFDIETLKTKFSISFIIDNKCFNKKENNYYLLLAKANRKFRLDAIYHNLLELIDVGDELEDFFEFGEKYER